MAQICIFIDNSNLFHAIRPLLTEKQLRLDYVALKEFLASGHPAEGRFYYSISRSPDSFDQEARKQYNMTLKFYEGIARLGYKTIPLPLRERWVWEGGVCKRVVKEKGLDCEIVYDMAVLGHSGRYDAFILVAGDEDYARTVRRIREDTNIPVDVAFFTHAGCSSILIQEASSFIDLSRSIDVLFRQPKSECRLRQRVC